MLFFPYDIETYPNVFTLALMTAEEKIIVFEISERRNDAALLLQWLYYIKEINGYMVGFNNEAFDYTVLHELVKNPNCTHVELYEMADRIINCTEKWPPKVWPRDRVAKQLDLYKINHFDNKARRTGLKVLEFNMRSENIEDLPYAPGTLLSNEQIDELITYNIHDVKETNKFLRYCLGPVQFRESLIPVLGAEVINFNDTKIGKEFFIKELTAYNPNSCYIKQPGSRGKGVMQQTKRDVIHLSEIIFDYVKFNSVEFNAVLDHLKTKTITETKKAPELNVTAYYSGVIFQFGNGGMHASIDSSTVTASNEHLIIDLDVTSYYPSLAISNRLYPEHLGESFCDIYNDLKKQRVNYPKGSAENKMLKLALNGVYGDSNNEYSPFYDPKYTMTITVNGQLLLCMLVEKLTSQINNLKLIQVNTDGLTVKVKKADEAQVMRIASDWEKYTGLDLERADYNRMFIRDVNNYIAETTDGKLKTKGAYCHIGPVEHEKNYTVDWHKNHSALIIPKAAQAALVDGVEPCEFIRNHDNLFNFMLRAKVPRSSRLEWHESDQIEILPNITRYYVSNAGGKLVKIMPPLPKAPEKERAIGVNIGYLTTPCNNLTGFNIEQLRATINYEFYINEADKLIKECRKCTI